ncbi:MAG: TRAM domain-containing protein, partial [Nitrospinaceae bacterium]
GETEFHFKHMVEFVREAEFDHVGVFTYNNEEGTTAYGYPDQVPEAVAEERKDELMRVQREICKRKNAARVGEVVPVLVEGRDREEDDLVTGRLPGQAPDIDGQIIIEESDVEEGDIVPMRITGAVDYDLIAKTL